MADSQIAIRAEEARDLRAQLGTMAPGAMAEIVFMDMTPRRWATIYSTETGEAVPVLEYHIEEVMAKRLPDGRPMFVARKENAPAIVQNHIKCFLARGSEQRDLVDELNISPGFYCRAESLQSELAAQVHAEHKHPTRWRILQDHLAREREEEAREMQRQQLEAMRLMAGQPARVASGTVTCDECGKECASAFGLKTHKRSHARGNG